MRQPPGSTVFTRPSRASSGAQKRMDARICAAVCPGRVLCRAAGERHIAALPPGRAALRPAAAQGSLHVRRALAPRAAALARWHSSDAASSGSTLFLLPPDADRSVQRPPARYHDLFPLCAISAAPIPQKIPRNVNPSDSTRALVRHLFQFI